MRALRKRCSEDDIDRVVGIAKRFPDMQFRFNMFCAPPMQTFVGVLKAVRLLLRTHVFLRNGRCQVSWIRVLPQTHMYDVAVSEGRVKDACELLPYDNHGLHKVFYECPRTQWYETPLFMGLLTVRKVAKSMIRCVSGALEWAGRALCIKSSLGGAGGLD